ncbi:MAG TPA: peptide chain release factor 3 [Kofleriaceae bacterium]|nr:peptide chain release factor 3 [Kofleriaceae bacterium]
MTPLPRRTFAIISHPDAGKTTLTEKLLLYGGAINLAGQVKARGERRRARSDWMKIERDRGISVTVSVMTFEADGIVFNLLDTPGHEDFSEDTYRTLTAVDSAIMVLDAAKGIEPQTRKLFEVCRLRDIPIITFINKLDREARDPFELFDEIADVLALDPTPASWPAGMGQRFRGTYDLFHNELALVDRAHRDSTKTSGITIPLDDAGLADHLDDDAAAALRDEVAMARELCPPFSAAAFGEGHMTPVFFGSALQSTGIDQLMRGVATLAPAPRSQPAEPRPVKPGEDAVTGFVFKIQANMDPRHRDRIAFLRLCSGHFRRGMKLFHVRTGKTLTAAAPLMFLARDRDIAEEAAPGDIIGLPNHGNLRIGDTLTEGEALSFLGIPSFAPEILSRVRSEDPMRAKHLGRALIQIAEEGAAQAFRTPSSEWIIGVVGALQLDVLQARLSAEYGLDIVYESAPIHAARWAFADDPQKLKKFSEKNASAIAEDAGGALVFLARNAWHLETITREWPEIQLTATRDQHTPR